MKTEIRSCPNCDTPVPVGARFCPRCGEATPTGIERATGEPVLPPLLEQAEAEYRQRLQRAIGEGYRLGELIGRGGFGLVYAAWEIALHREVAVKALRHDLFPTSELIERFQREARAAASLRHPNIIPIYAVGEGEGIVFMLMPNLLGESLSARLRRERRLPIAESVRILAEAARALGAAHRAGIVHRDVKPENIYLEGDEGRVYLMDFGIAKALGGEGEGLTGTGMIIGTPTFMSPEQAAGSPDIDHRADLYSLGVVGYQMLAGRLPYEAESLQELIYKQVTGDPPQLATLREDVPPAVARAIHRCLLEAPEARWDSAEELIAGLTGDARAPGTPVRRRPMVWLAVAAVVVAVGGAAVAGLRGASGANDPTVSPAAAAGPETDPASGGGNAAQPDSARDAAAVDGASRTGDAPTEGRVPESAPRPPEQPVRSPAPSPATPVAASVDSQGQAEPAGFLTVDATPWGMVQVDGVNLREGPVFRFRLSPGTHVVSVVRLGYRTWSDTVDITAGNTTSLKPSLIREQD